MSDITTYTRNLIMGGLRKAFSRSTQAKECRLNAIHPTVKGIRGGARFICAHCGGTFGAGGVNVDHRDEVIPVDRISSEMSWNEKIERLFCPVGNLQILCKVCHDKKTGLEQEARRATREEHRIKKLNGMSKYLTERDLLIKYKGVEEVTRKMFKKMALTEDDIANYGAIFYNNKRI